MEQTEKEKQIAINNGKHIYSPFEYSDFKNPTEYRKHILCGFGALNEETHLIANEVEAFVFVRDYQLADQFTKKALLAGYDPALKVLERYEDKIAKLKKDEKEKIQKEVEARNNARARASTLWKDKILPNFEEIKKEIIAFSKEDGFEKYFLEEEIKKELDQIETVAQIKVYAPPLMVHGTATA